MSASMPGGGITGWGEGGMWVSHAALEAGRVCAKRMLDERVCHALFWGVCVDSWMNLCEGRRRGKVYIALRCRRQDEYSFEV